MRSVPKKFREWNNHQKVPRGMTEMTAADPSNTILTSESVVPTVLIEAT